MSVEEAIDEIYKIHGTNIILLIIGVILLRILAEIKEQNRWLKDDEEIENIGENQTQK